MSLNIIPGRDAHATFAGYVFQVNVTILHWLELDQGTRLELEAGEDIDTVRSGSGGGDAEVERLVEQLKQLGRSITLRNPDVLEGMANFCELRRLNPGAILNFRFLTTAAVGREQSPWHDEKPAIEVWESVRANKISGAERGAALEQLRSFLLQCQNTGKISVNAWEALQSVLANPDARIFEALVNNLEWATESGNHEEVEQVICDVLQARDPDGSVGRAKVHYTNLFSFVLKLLAQKGKKELTSDLLAVELRATSVTLDDQLSAVRLRRWIDKVDAKLAAHESRIADHGSRIETLEIRHAGDRVRTFNPSETAGGDPGHLFDYNQTLRGRRRRVEQLNTFLNDPTKRIAVLPGRGGIGKTKLLRDWSGSTGSWVKLWVNPYGRWSGYSPREIPDADALLIADDAHRYGDLAQLISFVSQVDSTRSLKLIIATRPSGTAFIDEALAREADESFISRFDELQEPGPDATLEIAKELLNSEHEHLAEALARVSEDTPLVTVVGGRLIARGEILPELLSNDEAFRKAVFSKFADECEGNLPTGGKSRREVLQLIAAVQPVMERDERFADLAAVFLSLRPDQLWQGLDDLENRGILVIGRGGARIAPDLFGDYLLETASVGNHGAPTGFAETVFERFEETHLSNLLKNFAELDWRITQRNPESRLLDNIWSAIYARFRVQNAPARERFLREVKGIAVFQPERVEELVRIAMAEIATPAREWSFQRMKTQDDVLKEVPPLLGVTIYHEPSSRDAFTRLWTLSQHDSDKIHNRARKELKEAIGYHKYKNVIYNDRILAFAEERALDDSSYGGKFTPLSLMDELLDREVEDTGFRRNTFSITALPVNYPVIRPLRERALRVVNRALQSSSPRVAVLAVGSISQVMAVFHPRFRNEASESEREWQDAERMNALDMVEARITGGNLPLQLVWRLNRLLKDVQKRDGQLATIQERSAVLRSTLPLPEFFNLFDVVCTSEYEDGVIEMGQVSIPQSRRDQEQRAYADLRQRYPEVAEQIRILERILSQARDVDINPKQFGDVLFALCRDRAFLEGVSEHLVNEQNSVLISRANIPLSEWRRVDPSEYLRYGQMFSQSSNLVLVRTVGFCVAGSPIENDPIPEDVALLTLVAGRTEGYILGDVLFALKRLARSSIYSSVALAIFANMQVGNDEHLAKEYCDAVGAYGIPVALFDAANVERVLQNLIDIEQLDTDAIGSLMAHVCGVAPLAVVRFFEARILRQESLSDGGVVTDYTALPYSDSWSSLGAARASHDYRAAVAAFIDLAKLFPSYVLYLAPIFWHMAALDETTLSALDGLLHEDGDTGAGLVNDLLHKGPKGIALSHSTFAMHVLGICSGKGEKVEQEARSVLYANVLYASGVRVYAGSGPVQPDRSHIAPAAALRDLWAPGSLAHTFYAELANAERVTVSNPKFAQIDEDDEEHLSEPEMPVT
jgi:hypothetical protein